MSWAYQPLLQGSAQLLAGGTPTITLPFISATDTLAAPTLFQKAESLKDNFNDNSLNTTVWTSFGAGVSETSGEIQVALVGADAVYHGIYTPSIYVLTDSQMSVKVSNPGNQAWASIEVELQAIKDANNRVFFVIGGGTLYAYKEVAGAQSSPANIAYNSTTMAYLRIREASGTTYWEYSPDDETYTTLHSEATPFTLTALQLEIDAGNWSTETGTTTVSFDNFNIPALPVDLPSISSTETLYPPTVANAGAGAQSLTLPFISAANTLFAMSLAQNIALPAIASTSTLNSPSVVQNIVLPAISSTSTLNAPTVAVGAVTITLPFISSVSTLATPTITTGAVTVALPFIDDSADTMYPPTVVPVQSLTLPLISSSTTLHAPTVVTGAVTIVLPEISSTSSLNAPTISTGAVTIALPFIDDSNDTLYPPSLAQNIVLPSIASVTTLNVPTVTTGAVTIQLPFISSISSVFDMIVANAAGAQTLQLPAIPRDNTLFPMAVSQVVALPVIPSITSLNPPTISAFNTLLLPSIISGAIYAPTVSTDPPTILLPTIPSETVLFPPYRIEKPRKIFTGLGWH